MIHNLFTELKDSKRYLHKLKNTPKSNLCKERLSNIEFLSGLINDSDNIPQEYVNFLDACCDYQKAGYVSWVLNILSIRIGKRHLSDFYDNIQVAQMKDVLKLTWDDIFHGLKQFSESDCTVLLKKAPVSVGDYKALSDAVISDDISRFVDILNKTANTTEFNIKISYILLIIDCFFYGRSLGTEPIHDTDQLSVEIGMSLNNMVNSNARTNVFMNNLSAAVEKIEFVDELCEKLKNNGNDISSFLKTNVSSDRIESLKHNLKDDFEALLFGSVSILMHVEQSLSPKENAILDEIRDDNIYISQIFNMVYGPAEDVSDQEEEDFSDDTDTRPLPPVDLKERGTRWNSDIMRIICTHLQECYFERANIKDIEFVFFGKGKRPEKSLKLITTKSKLSNMISFVTGNKNKSNETWIFFASYINNKDGNPVFPLDPEHKDWKHNHPSGLAKDKHNFKVDIKNLITSQLGRDLTNEEKEDLK